MSIKIRINGNIDNVYATKAKSYSIVQDQKIIEANLEDNKVYQLGENQVLVAWFNVYINLNELWNLEALTHNELKKLKNGYIRRMNYTLNPEDQEVYQEILGNDFESVKEIIKNLDLSKFNKNYQKFFIDKIKKEYPKLLPETINTLESWIDEFIEESMYDIYESYDGQYLEIGYGYKKIKEGDIFSECYFRKDEGCVLEFRGGVGNYCDVLSCEVQDGVFELVVGGEVA